MVVIQGKPDILKNTSQHQHQTPSSVADQLLDLNEVKTSKPDSEFLVSLDFSQEESLEELKKSEPQQVVISQAAKVDILEESCHHDLLDSADDEALKLSESAMPISPLVSLFFLQKLLLVPKVTKDKVSSNPPLHRGSSSTCRGLVRDLAINIHFLGLIGFL